MSDATARPEVKPQPSLFTRLALVEAELRAMKGELAGLKEDHESLRADRDEWRWRAEYLLAERKEEFFDRWSRRIVGLAKSSASWLNGVFRRRWSELREALRPRPDRLPGALLRTRAARAANRDGNPETSFLDR